MVKTSLIKSAKYLVIIRNKIEKYIFATNKYKNIRKSRNKMVGVLAKSKSRKLVRIKFRNLSKFENLIKVSNANIIKKIKYLTLDIRIDFTKLRQIFIQVLIFNKSI